MRLPPRCLALLVVVAHVAAVAAPCLAAATAEARPHLAAAEVALDAETPPHCAEPARQRPPDASAPCPCGCGDASSPGGLGGRLGFALPAAAEAPPAPERRRATERPAPRPVTAPARTPDPIPI